MKKKGIFQRWMATLLCLILAGMLSLPVAAQEETAKGVAVALGDSITTGYGLADKNQNYAALAAAQKGMTLENAAQDGMVSSSLLAQLQSGALDSLLSKADCVVLTIGGNDLMEGLYAAAAQQLGCTVTELKVKLASGNVSVQELTAIATAAGALAQGGIKPALALYQANLSGILDFIKAANSQAQVILQTQYNPYFWLQGNPMLAPVVASVDAVVKELNAVITAAAGIKGCKVADVYTAFMASQAPLTNAAVPDMQHVNLDFHPNQAGHQAIAALVAAQMEEKPAPAPEKPAAPELSLKANTDKSITLSWTPVDEADGYVVYGFDKADLKSITERKIVSKARSRISLSYQPGTARSFLIRAYRNIEGKNVYSDKSNQVITATKPARAVIKAVTPKKGSAYVALKSKSAGAQGYAYCASTDGKTYKIIAKGPKMPYTMKGLKKGTNYIKVRAYVRDFSGKTIYADWSQTVKTVVK